MSNIAGKKAKVMQTGSALTFTDEATTTSDNITYTISSATKNIWDRTYTITVKDGGSPTAESYTINRLKGTITFSGSGTRTITVSGKYLPTTEIANAREVSYTIEADNQDITVFGQSYINRLQGLLDFTGSLSNLYTDDSLQDTLIAGVPYVLEIYNNRSSNYDLRAWVIFASIEQSGSADGVVEESVEFEGTNDDDERCVATYS